jgi:hypothetical protein
MQIHSFDMQFRTMACDMPADGLEGLPCPACGSELALHQPEKEVPARLLATCICEECAIWLALAFTPDRGRIYMVRIPSTAEFLDAFSRRDGQSATD